MGYWSYIVVYDYETKEAITSQKFELFSGFQRGFMSFQLTTAPRKVLSDGIFRNFNSFGVAWVVRLDVSQDICSV